MKNEYILNVSPNFFISAFIFPSNGILIAKMETALRFS